MTENENNPPPPPPTTTIQNNINDNNTTTTTENPPNHQPLTPNNTIPQTNQNQNTPSHSPSPLPPRPISQTPGPRATRLQQIFDQALLRTIRSNSYSNFSSCFPTPARHVPSSLESVWRQLNAKLEESAKAEFSDILVERGVVEGLNELDRLVGEGRVRKDYQCNVHGVGDGNGGSYSYVYFISFSSFFFFFFLVFLFNFFLLFFFFFFPFR